MLQDLRRRVVAGNQDERERLIVPQLYVVARRQPLDEIALQQQRLDLGVRGDDFERRGLRHHALQPVGQAIDLRIGGDSLAQAARLADIERIALGVEHAVDAGTGRQILELRSEDLDAALEARRARIGFARRINIEAGRRRAARAAFTDRRLLFLRVQIGDSLAQAARLADIERIALGVEHAVDAGTGRQILELRSEDLDAALEARRARIGFARRINIEAGRRRAARAAFTDRRLLFLRV